MKKNKQKKDNFTNFNIKLHKNGRFNWDDF